MAKKRRDQQPFAIQQFFMHKAKPWRKKPIINLTRSESALNSIIRRLKCTNASQLFNNSSNTNKKKLTRSNSIPSRFPFLSRNIEQAVNSWPLYEQKRNEYSRSKQQNKPVDIEEPDQPEPIIEFPPDDKNDHSNEENLQPQNNDDSKSANFGPTTSGLTRWKNTFELMPSPIVSSENPKYKHLINDCSFESVQSLPHGSPSDKLRSKMKKKADPQEVDDALSTTLPIVDNFNDSFVQSTPAFVKAWKPKARRNKHSTPKNAFI